MAAQDGTDALQLVLDKLDGVVSRGGYYMARCPAHDDFRQSLSVQNGDTQGVIFHCHANCEPGDVLAAIGLTTADISPARDDRDEWTPRGPAIAVYDYHDEHGSLLYQVLRTAGKEFPQRRPDPSERSGWSWKLGNCRRVPYHLPALLEGVKAGARVFVVEGERDVHSMERAGAVATTSPGGAGNWKPAFNQFFAGADVVIIADLDPPNKQGRRPGIEHALQVQQNLQGVALAVRIFTAAQGKDATDHFAAGLGLDDFKPWAETEVVTTYWRRMTIGAVMTAGIPKPKILENLLYSGKLHSLAGPPEAGKTVLSLHLAIAVMRMGLNVLFWDEEGGGLQTASILQSLGAEPELVDKRFFYFPFPGSQWTPKDCEELDTLMRDVKPRLAIWDSSAAMMGLAGVDENHPGEVTRFWGNVYAPVARVHGCAVLVLDHDTKNGGTESRYARGSGAKLAGVDVGIKVEPLRPFTRAQDGLLALSVTKDRAGWLHRNWRVKVSHDPLRLFFTKSSEAQPDKGTGLSPAQQKLLDVLTDMPSTVAQLVDRVVERFGHGLRHDTVQREMNALMNGGLADRADQGAGRAALWMAKKTSSPGDTVMPPAGGDIWPDSDPEK